MTRFAHFPDDDNGDVLRRMQQDGDDLAKPRDIDFTVVFAVEASARAFRDYFRSLGYSASAQRTDTVQELPWDVVVVHNMAPTHAAITGFEQMLASAAAKHGGRNDGWGCFSQ